jgi:hypothetical protein
MSTTEELLGRNSSGSGLEIRAYGHRDVTLSAWNPLSAKVGINFADKRRSLGNSGHGVFLYTGRIIFVFNTNKMFSETLNFVLVKRTCEDICSNFSKQIKRISRKISKLWDSLSFL